MTAISDFCSTVRSWLNRKDLSDDVVTSLVRMGEERINDYLRVKDMLVIATLPIEDGRVLLPSDWLELELVRWVGGRDLRFIPRSDMYASAPENTENKYTISGNYITFGGVIVPADDAEVEIHYLASIPPLGDTPNWLLTKHPTLFVSATLVMASAFGFEDERAASWDASVTAKINQLNSMYLQAKASGSRLTRTNPARKGFE